jgi:hypothetical protein
MSAMASVVAEAGGKRTLGAKHRRGAGLLRPLSWQLHHLALELSRIATVAIPHRAPQQQAPGTGQPWNEIWRNRSPLNSYSPRAMSVPFVSAVDELRTTDFGSMMASSGGKLTLAGHQAQVSRANELAPAVQRFGKVEVHQPCTFKSRSGRWCARQKFIVPDRATQSRWCFSSGT